MSIDVEALSPERKEALERVCEKIIKDVEIYYDSWGIPSRYGDIFRRYTSTYTKIQTTAGDVLDYMVEEGKLNLCVTMKNKKALFPISVVSDEEIDAGLMQLDKTYSQ